MEKENITLEDILQKHFGLKGNLWLKKPVVEGWVYGGDAPPDPMYRNWTTKGFKAYTDLTMFLYDFADFVRQQFDDNQLADDLVDLIDDLDEIEHEPLY